MKTVLIVGAGGSLAQAQSFRPKQSRLHPPLDLGFFAKAAVLADGGTAAVARSRDRLLREIAASNGAFPDPYSSAVGPALEQYFADVYYEVASGPKDSFPVFLALLRLYNDVLAETTNWMAIRQDTGALGRLIRTELKRANPDRLSVITFNQDLVIENVVQRLPQRYQTWCLAGLYGDLRLDPLYPSSSNTPVFPHHSNSCAHTSPILLLKLHGSLNWGTRTLKEDPAISTIFPNQSRKYFVWNDREIDVGVLMEGLTRKGRQSWYVWPLVVPPIYDKQRMTGRTVLQGAWDQARNAIWRAERLVLVGYSIPEADVLARQMIRRGFLENQDLRSVYCVNPDASLALKVKTALDSKIVHMYHELSDYLEDQAA